MNCPHCKKPIDRHEIAAHLGRAGGLKRTPLTEAQKVKKRAILKLAREKRWAKKEKESDNYS